MNEDLFGSRRGKFVSILSNSPFFPSPTRLSETRAASPERESTGSKTVLENETRERKKRFGPRRDEINPTISVESWIVIEKIRTYATVDGKIYWCSLNF